MRVQPKHSRNRRFRVSNELVEAVEPMNHSPNRESRVAPVIKGIVNVMSLYAASLSFFGTPPPLSTFFYLVVKRRVCLYREMRAKPLRETDMKDIRAALGCF
jgi:hypothetical protein